MMSHYPSANSSKSVIASSDTKEYQELSSQLLQAADRCVQNYSESMYSVEAKKHKLDEEIHLNSVKFKMQEVERENGRLRTDMRVANLRLEQLQVELGRGRQEVAEIKSETENRIVQTSKAGAACESKLAEANDQLQRELNSTRQELFNLMRDHSATMEELAQTKQNLETNSRSLEAMEHFIEEKKAELSEVLQLKATIEQMTRDHKDQAAVATLKQQLAELAELKPAYASIKREYDRIKQLHQNSRLLEEEARDLRLKVAKLEAAEQRAAAAEVQRDELKIKVAAWEKQLGPADGVQRRIAQLQHENRLLEDVQGDLRSSLAANQAQMETLRHQVNESAAKLTARDATVDLLSKELTRQKQRVNVLTSERDMYKRLLDSYEKELTADAIGQEQRRLRAELEIVLGKYRSQAGEQEMEIQRLTQQILATASAAGMERGTMSHWPSEDTDSVDRKLIVSLRNQIVDLEEQVRVAKEEKDELQLILDERNMLLGEYDPRSERVLHLADNPANRAVAEVGGELTRLRRENAKLTQRVQVLEHLVSNRPESSDHMPTITTGYIGAPGDVTLAVESRLRNHPDPLTELQELERKLQLEKMRHSRLMEGFEKMSGRLRRVCSNVLGYDVQLKDEGRVCRLRSTYAADDDEVIFFKWKEDDTMVMVRSDFADRIKSKAKSYAGCPPALLAFLTLDYYRQTTLIVD